jgi:methionine aminopeptidase
LPCHPTQEPLKAGDIVKMDLGCHIDGYIAVAAHTCVVKETADDPEPPKDEMLSKCAVAAYNAMLVAAACITAGKTNSDVTKAVDRVAKAYGVTPISSVRMHQMKRYVLDGVKEVALNLHQPDDPEEEKVPDCTFEQAEVYAVGTLPCRQAMARRDSVLEEPQFSSEMSNSSTC